MTLLPSPKLKIKTDNQSLGDKLALRRQVIKKAGLEPLRVLDLFAGEGVLWSHLRRESRLKNAPAPLDVIKYTPIDSAARQPGQIRFKITPRLIAALDEDDGMNRFNTVDIDCFGDPFAIWQAVLFRIRIPTAVFLTRGRVTYGAGRMPISKLAKKVMDIPESWDVPGKVELMEYGDRAQLLQPCPTAKIKWGYQIKLRRVDYYGLYVEPTEQASASATPSARRSIALPPEESDAT